MKSWKIGELARQTGVSMRTLRHYEEVGLLRPIREPASNYRRYGEADVERLQRIISLRQLGLSLKEIGRTLDEPGGSLAEVLEGQLEQLRGRLRSIQWLVTRLERLTALVRTGALPDAETLIETMEEMTMFERYYSPEQLRMLEERRRKVGDGRISAVETEWPRLMSEVRAEMERGTSPSEPRVRELARRWRTLIEEFTGGDPGIAASMERMYASEEEVHGMDTAPMREMSGYLARAFADDTD